MVSKDKTDHETQDGIPYKSAKGRSQSHKWFNPQLRPTDVKWLQDNGDSLASLFLELLDDLEDEEKLSVKYDTFSRRWMAILFAGTGKCRNSGFAMSVRGATPFDSCIALAYCHIVRFKDGWAIEESGSESRWG